MSPMASREARADMPRPRLGFLGVGWIGRQRMQAVIAPGAVEPVALADSSPEMAEAAHSLAPTAEIAGSLDDLLRYDLDGIVIATPSALHADQSIQALERGVAVFCQKPLGRNREEVARVVEAARSADRLLGVDLSYRHTQGMRRIRELISSGRLGEIFAADLVFHNAYGPGKPWFYDKALSGGGCVIDLGVHLVDIALWTLDFPEVAAVTSSLVHAGGPLADDGHQVEDYAVATIELRSGAVIRIACSWRLHAGRDAVIEMSFHGTQGGAAMRNAGGSFLDFAAEHFEGTQTRLLASPPDDWGGRAVADWARKLSMANRFDPECERFVDVAGVLDRIYQR